MAGVYDARILYYVGDFLRRVVAAFVPAALLVAQAGRNRRRALHATDAFSFGGGGWGLCADADLPRRALDAGRAISMVLGHLRRVLFRQLRLGGAGGGLCHHHAPATPAHPRPRAARQPVLFPGAAVLRVHHLPGLLRIRAILYHLEREQTPRDLLVPHPRKRFLVVGKPAPHLRPFPAAVLR